MPEEALAVHQHTAGEKSGSMTRILGFFGGLRFRSNFPGLPPTAAMALSLPVFAETLDAYGISLKLLFRALDEYYDLSTEVLLDLEPQLEPFHFLAQSDQRDRIVAFRGLLVAQSPGTYYLPDEDEDEEGEGE